MVGIACEEVVAVSGVVAPSAVRQATSAGSTGPPARRTRRRLALGWEPPGGLNRAGWLALGVSLAEFGRVNNWWVGDWIRYGTAAWGERYVEAARITGLDPKTLRNIAYVAGRFDLSRRRDKLAWSHHAEVAALEPEQQEIWLDRAISSRLSPADLRIELRTAQRGLGSPQPTRPESLTTSKDTNVLACPQCGFKLQVTG